MTMTKCFPDSPKLIAFPIQLILLNWPTISIQNVLTILLVNNIQHLSFFQAAAFSIELKSYVIFLSLPIYYKRITTNALQGELH